jgi:hypothetical protein
MKVIKKTRYSIDQSKLIFIMMELNAATNYFRLTKLIFAEISFNSLKDIFIRNNSITFLGTWINIISIFIALISKILNYKQFEILIIIILLLHLKNTDSFILRINGCEE